MDRVEAVSIEGRCGSVANMVAISFNLASGLKELLLKRPIIESTFAFIRGGG